MGTTEHRLVVFSATGNSNLIVFIRLYRCAATKQKDARIRFPGLWAQSLESNASVSNLQN
jgi:hypothetical protein